MCIRIFFLLIFFISFKTLVFAQSETQLPNDTRWVTESSEYVAICEQIYMNAWFVLRQRLQNLEEPCIIMDLDETVLDNSQYQVDLYQKSETFNIKSWNKFVKKEVSTLVPGVKDFILRYKKNKKAKIIYISNRDHITLKATKNNMKQLGIYFEDDIYLLKKDETDTKIIRREEVLKGTGRMESHGAKEVIAYFGDAMGDFPNDKKYQFSINKFIFPNPMYGKW